MAASNENFVSNNLWTKDLLKVYVPDEPKPAPPGGYPTKILVRVLLYNNCSLFDTKTIINEKGEEKKELINNFIFNENGKEEIIPNLDVFFGIKPEGGHFKAISSGRARRLDTDFVNVTQNKGYKLKDPRVVVIIPPKNPNIMFFFQFPAGLLTEKMFEQQPLIISKPKNAIDSTNWLAYNEGRIYWFTINSTLTADPFSSFSIYLPVTQNHFLSIINLRPDGMPQEEYTEWLAKPERRLDTEVMAAIIILFYQRGLELTSSPFTNANVFDKEHLHANIFRMIDTREIKEDVELFNIMTTIVEYFKIKEIIPKRVIEILTQYCYCGLFSTEETLYVLPFIQSIFEKVRSRPFVSRIADEIRYLYSQTNFMDDPEIKAKLASKPEYDLIQDVLSLNTKTTLSDFFNEAESLKNHTWETVLTAYKTNKDAYINKDGYLTFFRICFALSTWKDPSEISF